MSRRNQNPWTPEAKTGVNYFKHTTKHFLTPYGKTHGALTSREILDKLFHWNCEWLTRPNYDISELADTLYSNLATLAEYRDKVFTQHVVDPLLNKARPIRTVLQRFNKKDCNSGRTRRTRSCHTNEIHWGWHPQKPLPALIRCIGRYVLDSYPPDDSGNAIQPSGWICKEAPWIAWSTEFQTESVSWVYGRIHCIPNTKPQWNCARRGTRVQ